MENICYGNGKENRTEKKKWKYHVSFNIPFICASPFCFLICIWQWQLQFPASRSHGMIMIPMILHTFLKEQCVFLAFPGFWQALPGKEIQFTPKSLFLQAFTIGLGRSAWRRNPGHGFVSFFLELVTEVVAGSRYPADHIGPRRCPGARSANHYQNSVLPHGSIVFPRSSV